MGESNCVPRWWASGAAVARWGLLWAMAGGCGGPSPEALPPLVLSEPLLAPLKPVLKPSTLSPLRVSVTFNRAAERGGDDPRFWGQHTEDGQGLGEMVWGGPTRAITLPPESEGWQVWFHEWSEAVVKSSGRELTTDESARLLQVDVNDIWLETGPDRCRYFLAVRVVEAETYVWEKDRYLNCLGNQRGYAESHMDASRLLGQRLQKWLGEPYEDRETLEDEF